MFGRVWLYAFWLLKTGILHAALCALAWVVGAAFGPRADVPYSTSFETMGFWDSAVSHAEMTPSMVGMMTGQSLFLLALFGRRWRRKSPVGFKTAFGLVMLLPLWWLLVVGSVSIFIAQLTAQLLCVWLMPGPPVIAVAAALPSPAAPRSPA